MIHRIFLLACVGAFIGFAVAADDTTVDAQEQVVHTYIAAFNAHDTEAMLSMVTDDVQWLSVDGETITIETNNKEELRNGMAGYFESCESCQSRIAKIFSTGTRVSALEVASFDTADGGQEQQSVSLYEFSGTLIKRIYYFPVED